MGFTRPPDDAALIARLQDDIRLLRLADGEFERHHLQQFLNPGWYSAGYADGLYVSGRIVWLRGVIQWQPDYQPWWSSNPGWDRSYGLNGYATYRDLYNAEEFHPHLAASNVITPSATSTSYATIMQGKPDSVIPEDLGPFDNTSAVAHIQINGFQRRTCPVLFGRHTNYGLFVTMNYLDSFNFNMYRDVNASGGVSSGFSGKSYFYGGSQPIPIGTDVDLDLLWVANSPDDAWTS